MRILFFTFEYPPLGGGVATAAEALIEELVKQGVEVDVVTGGWIKNSKLKIQNSKLQVYRLPVYWNQNQAEKGPGVLQVILYLKLAFLLGIYLRFKTTYNLIHVFGFPSGILGLLLSGHIPFIVSLRGVDVPGYNPKFDWWHRLALPITKLSWQKAKVVVANSHSLQKLALDICSNLSIKVIPNGVDTKLFKPIKDNQKFSQFTITAGGTLLNSKKGLADLIAGFALFAHQHPQVRLLLIGEGPLRSKLEAQVTELGLKKSVKFMGRKSRKWLSANLPKCHICCLPSTSESMSNAILESMACGLPVITTPASKELIDGKGIVIDYHSPEQITQALTQIYTDPKLQIELGKQSRLLAENLSWQSVGKKYSEIVWSW